jgi:hypothetical protein
MLNFPDFEKKFHVFTDASDYQLGSVSMQDDKPLVFYSRKLNSAQKNYTTVDKELLSIVEVLKEFRDILFGQKLIVYTDHKNLLYRKLPTQQIMRWRMLLEEYDAQYEHVKGVDNVVADGISRLSINWAEAPLEADPVPHLQSYALSRITRDESIEINHTPGQTDFAASYVMEKDIEETEFPMAPKLIRYYQEKDKKLKKAIELDTKGCSSKAVEGVRLVHYKTKIYFPKLLHDRN